MLYPSIRGGSSNGLTGQTTTLTFDVYYDEDAKKYYCDDVEAICKVVFNGTSWRESVCSLEVSDGFSQSSGFTHIRIINMINPGQISTSRVTVDVLDDSFPYDIFYSYISFLKQTADGIDSYIGYIKIFGQDMQDMDPLPNGMDVSSLAKVAFTIDLYA